MGSSVGSLNVRINADISGLKKGLNNAEREIRGSTKTVNQSFSGLSSTFKGLGGAIAGAFAVGTVVDFGKAVLETRAQFEKFEATLRVALGSQSEAQKALRQINQYVATTNFQINEVTDSFTKLANRGVRLTVDQMETMGDLANALGKDFSQLSEAVLDISNTERWNELGIKVTTVGDKIQGTFKGITVEADRTERGALELVQAFGKLDGVAGITSEISQTMGGQLSNLSDNFTNLRNEIGKLIDQDAGGFFAELNGIISSLNSTLSGISDPAGALVEDGGFAEAAKQLVNLQVQYREAAARAQETLNNIGLIPNSQKERLETLSEAIRRQKEVLDDFRGDSSSGGVQQQVEQTVVSLQSMSDELEKLRQARLTAPLEDVYALNVEIAKLESKIESIANPTIDLSIASLDTGLGLKQLSDSLQLSDVPDALRSVQAEAMLTKEQMQQLAAPVFDFTNAFSGIGQTISQELRSGIQGYKSFGDAVSSIIKTVIVQLTTMVALQAAFTALTGGAGAGGGFLKGLIGGFNIPGLASGGLVTSPGIYQIAEGGESEAVIPLSRLENMVGSGSGGRLTTEISGDKLRIILDRADGKASRVF